MSTPLSSSGRRATRAILAPLALLTLLGGALGACSASSGSYADAAKKLIEGDLADQAGLGALKAECDQPAGTSVGEEFSCTAETEDGQIVSFTATIEAGNKVDVTSSNLVSGAVLGKLEEAARNALAEEVGIELGPETLDCGADTVILDDAGQMFCTFIDPDTGDEYDATITVTDLQTGDLTIKIADAPRG